MPVTAVLESFASHLAAALDDAVSVGLTQPEDAADLPTVSLSLPEVDASLPGVGRRPAPLRTGALPVERQLDLADPVLRFGTEAVPLISSDRRTLHLPHGPIVRADGGTDGPFTAADLTIRRGATVFAVVAGAPGAGECRPDPATGEVLFGSPLPGTGTLELSYLVGQWEVRSERYSGVLLVESFAASASAVATLSNAVVTALDGPVGTVHGVHRLDPTAVGPITAVALAQARVRRLSYRFDFEHEDAVLPTGGGPIRRMDVVVDQARQTSPSGPPVVDPEGHEAFSVR